MQAFQRKKSGDANKGVPTIMDHDIQAGVEEREDQRGLLLLLLLQLCLTLCDPIDSSPPGSSVPGILQARLLEWLPFPSSMHACMLSRSSCVRLCATSWTAAHQAPLSTGFSRQGYWSGLPFPSCKRGLMNDKDMTERLHFWWGPTTITLFLIVRIFNGPKRKSVYCPTLNEGSIRSGRMFDFLFAVF